MSTFQQHIYIVRVLNLKWCDKPCYTVHLSCTTTGKNWFELVTASLNHDLSMQNGSTHDLHWNFSCQMICKQYNILNHMFSNPLHIHVKTLQMATNMFIMINMWVCVCICVCMHMHAHLINLDLIKLIQFCLKIYDLWRHPHLWMGGWVGWWVGQVKSLKNE